MISNRNSPRIIDLIDDLPDADKTEVNAALDELAQNGLTPKLNPQNIIFNKYKITAGNGVQIIFEYYFSSGERITIVDIQQRSGLMEILRKIGKAGKAAGKAIDINP